ncbi:epoxyqueuosine reductase [Aquihabitans daechungensis]|uniref:epoxyqueuosine reductase n=1 Tax=Aquihabitans daechungensis TaxID=1052257 RepID=UPI003BA04821
MPDAPRAERVADGCGTCERCRPACPTDAIVAPGTVDARRCLSWTLQMTGSFPRDQRVALGDRLYGCDECQEVCPPNRLEVRRAAPGGSGTPVALGRAEAAWVPVLGVLAATDEELLDRHGRWYIPERDPRYLRRNALVVLGNVGEGTDPAVRAALARALRDDDPLLRAHAVWSARRLGCDDLLVDVTGDPDPDVQAELAAAVPVRAPA